MTPKLVCFVWDHAFGCRRRLTWWTKIYPQYITPPSRYCQVDSRPGPITLWCGVPPAERPGGANLGKKGAGRCWKHPEVSANIKTTVRPHLAYGLVFVSVCSTVFPMCSTPGPFRIALLLWRSQILQWTCATSGVSPEQLEKRSRNSMKVCDSVMCRSSFSEEYFALLKGDVDVCCLPRGRLTECWIVEVSHQALP